jgi:septal ring factor EnvC (AmiA/AmiB activator)
MLSIAGCAGSIANPQPSYADLVVTYNAEQETLDRLVRQRAELIANYERQMAPDTDQAIRALTDVLNSAAGAGRDVAADAAGDPYAALDQAVASAEKTQEVTAQLLDSARQATREEAAATAEYPEELQKKLAALDEEIAAQQARVDRARAARDAAEPK